MPTVWTALVTATLMSASTAWAADHPIDLTPTEGEVRKVDANAKKLTLRHGEIKNLDMPSMTMVFHVKDPAMLEQVKRGDKVIFTVQKLNGVYTVMSLEAAK